jgi:hypothetical protein
MAQFRIQYVTTGDKPQRDWTHWVTPDHFTVAQARDSFIRQSPTAVVGTVVRLSDNA